MLALKQQSTFTTFEIKIHFMYFISLELSKNNFLIKKKIAYVIGLNQKSNFFFFRKC